MRTAADRYSLDHTTFRKFRRFYLLAFLLIALSVIVAQVLIQSHLNAQLDDSSVVNIAGRQRMLSQKIVKELLYVDLELNDQTLEEVKALVQSDLDHFVGTHEKLKSGVKDFGAGEGSRSDMGLHALIREIDGVHADFVIEIQDHLLGLGMEEATKSGHRAMDGIQALERDFLLRMDRIVKAYEEESRAKVERLKGLEYLLLGISLLILVLEILFLFRPISKSIKQIISDLLSTQSELEQKVKDVSELYASKEHSLRELQGLNYAINNAALYMNLNSDGSLIHISKKFARLIGYDSTLHKNIDELLSLEEEQEEVFSHLMRKNPHGIWTQEIKVLTLAEQELWLELSVVPMNQVKRTQSFLFLCTDITKRVKSQNELLRMSEERLRKEVDLQKLQASQIVEAQEEERKRIAKDIHDGIGQMLTALKFNMESLDLETINPEGEEKVKMLREMLTDLIREVRAVTFNLTPPELQDYGIVPTLDKLAQQLSSLTGRKVIFENRTGFKGRFDNLIETNLYRVVQEGVNNALKYADSSYILIGLSHSEDKLSIVIDDDGKGFDLEGIERKGEEFGLGLYFMKERISYINGRIFMTSRKGKGTRITINLNL